MKVETNQDYSLADSFIETPASNFDQIATILDTIPIRKILNNIKTDYDPESLFRALLLREFLDLSYERLSESLRRDLVFIKFCGFSMNGNKPDETTLERFRDRLIVGDLWSKLLDEINFALEKLGLKIKCGEYLSADATLIPSARRPRKVYKAEETEEGVHKVEKIEYSDDVDASWKCKGKGKLVYGYAAYAITDSDGLVAEVSVKPANESEMTNFTDEIVKKVSKKHGSKKVRVLYDKGVDSKANRESLKAVGIKDGIMYRKPKGKEMPYWKHVKNKLISKRRFVVERTFGTLKRTYGLRRAKLLGLDKVLSEVICKSIAYNLRRSSNGMASVIEKRVFNVPTLAIS